MSQNNVGIYASQISGHLWAPNGAYDALATVTAPSGGAATVQFNGIPSGYKHLQIRMTTRASSASTSDNVSLQFNSDTGSNYSWHYMYGAGSGTPTSAGSAPTSNIFALQTTGSTAAASTFGVAIIDLLDYSSTTINKTIRSLNGYDLNGSGYVFFQSGNWRNTSAISSITFGSTSGFAQYSSIALYGVK